MEVSGWVGGGCCFQFNQSFLLKSELGRGGLGAVVVGDASCDGEDFFFFFLFCGATLSLLIFHLGTIRSLGGEIGLYMADLRRCFITL